MYEMIIYIALHQIWKLHFWGLEFGHHFRTIFGQLKGPLMKTFIIFISTKQTENIPLEEELLATLGEGEGDLRCKGPKR